MCSIFFVWGFSFVFAIWPLLIASTIGIFVCMAYRSFEKDPGHYIPVEKIKETEEKLGGAKL